MRKIAHGILGLSALFVLTFSACDKIEDLETAPLPELVKLFPDRLSESSMSMAAGHGYMAAHYHVKGQSMDSSRWVLMNDEGEVLWTKDFPVVPGSAAQIDPSGNIHIVSGKSLLVVAPTGMLVRQETEFFDKLQSAPFILTVGGEYILWGGLSSFNSYGIVEKWTSDGQQVFRTVLKANTAVSGVVVDGLGDILVWGNTTRSLQSSYLLKLTSDGEALWYRHHKDPEWIDSGQSNYNWLYTYAIYPTAHGSLYGFMRSQSVWLYEFDYEGRTLDSSKIDYPDSYDYSYVASSSPDGNGNITLYLATSQGFHNGFFGKTVGVHIRKGLETGWSKDVQRESRDRYFACSLIDRDRIALWGKMATDGPYYQPVLIITDPNEQ